MKEEEGEHPLSDAVQLILLLAFLFIWIGDSFVLNISTFLSKFIPLALRLTVLCAAFITALLLLRSAHFVISHKERPDHVVSTGVFRFIRHPLYLASMLVYFGLAVSTASILPRNEFALREKCDALLHKLQETTEFPAREAIAKELSYITDPIAIPYLSKLVEEKKESAAILELIRIGTDEALEAMIVVTQSKYNEAAAAYAKSLLRQKMPEIRNPNIREKLRSAVEAQ